MLGLKLPTPTKMQRLTYYSLVVLLGANLSAATTYTWTNNDNNNNWPDDGNWSGGGGAPGRSANDDTAILDGSFSNTSSEFDLELTSQNRPNSPTILSMLISTDNANDDWDIVDGHSSGAALSVSGYISADIDGSGSCDIHTDLKLADSLLTIGASGQGMHIRGNLIGNNNGSGDGTLNLNSSSASIEKGSTVYFHGSNPNFDGTVKVGFTKLDIQNINAFDDATIELENHSHGADRINYITNTEFGALTGTKPLELISGRHLRVGTKGSNFTYDGILQGSGTLEKRNTGIWTLTAANTHTGTTTITNGSIRLSNANALQSSPLTINANNGLDITTNNINPNLHSLAGSGSFSIGDQTVTLNGNLSSNVTFSGELEDNQSFGTVIINTTGSGKHILTYNNSNLYAEFILRSGTLQVNDNTQLGSPNVPFTFGNGHLLAVAPSSFTLDKQVSFDTTNSHGQITVFNGSSTLTFPRALVGDADNILEILSGGTVAFSSSYCDYHGTIRINGGSLSLGNGGTFDLSRIDLLSDNDLILPDSNVTFGSLSGSGDFSIGTSNTLNIGSDNRSTTYTGTIFGTGSSQVVKAGTGTFTLGGTLSLTQDMLLNDGVIILDGDTTTSMAAGISSAADTSLEGTGRISGALDLSGDISPDNPGVDNYGTIRAGGMFIDDRFHCDISDSGVDLLMTDGFFDASNCTLDLNLIDGALTQAAYIIVDYGNLSGTFPSVLNLPLGYKIDYDYNDGSDSNNIAIVADNTAPTLSITTTEPNPTNANSIAYSIAFNEPITGLINSSDLYITGTTIATTDITATTIVNSGDDQNFTLTLNNISSDGFLQFRLKANQITDQAGNNLASDPFSPGLTIDNTKPVVTRTGDASITLVVGDSWSDPGATVTDNIDNDITAIVGGDTVDTNNAGSYNITYDATDDAGNAATQRSRTVTVITVIEGWLDDHGLTAADALMTADPDGDGRNNLEEFAFDGDPNNANDSDKTKYEIADFKDSDHFILTIPARSGAAFSHSAPSTATVDGITYSIHGAVDLSDFSTTVHTNPSPDLSGLPLLNTGWSYYSFVIGTTTPKGFLRTSVQEAP